MDLRPYICNQCGGPINVAKMRCEHCGTEYYDKSLSHITISAARPGEATIRAEVRIDAESMRYDPERARDYTLRELRNQIADGLLAYMRVQTCTDFNPRYMGSTEIIRGHGSCR
jgi:hypothetical protein